MTRLILSIITSLPLDHFLIVPTVSFTIPVVPAPSPAFTHVAKPCLCLCFGFFLHTTYTFPPRFTTRHDEQIVFTELRTFIALLLSKTEKDLFKIQQHREKDVFKIQQEKVKEES